MAIIGLLVFTPLGQTFKDRIINIINPAITQRKTIADFQQSLTTLSKTINDPKFQKMSDAEQLSKLNGMVKGASTLAETAQKTASKNDITAGISAIIQKFTPAQSSPSNCPTP